MISVLLMFFEIANDSSLSYSLKMYLSSFYKAIFNTCEHISYCGFNLHFPMINNADYKNIYTCHLYAIWEMSVQVFWPLFEFVCMYVCVRLCMYIHMCVCVYTFVQVYSPCGWISGGQRSVPSVVLFWAQLFSFLFCFGFLLNLNLKSTISHRLPVSTRDPPFAAHPSTRIVNVSSSCFYFF